MALFTAYSCWLVWQATPKKRKLIKACIIGMAVAALVAGLQPSLGELFGKTYPPSSFHSRWLGWTLCFTLLGGGLYLKSKDPDDPSNHV
jgi:hypothetical protein